MANKDLHTAKDAKKDEFYTQLEDINAEMIHYEKQFQGKTIFMNCDDPTWSNFWRYFHLEFERLGLKKIVSTHYEPGEVASYKMEYTGGDDENVETGVKTNLTQNGDFRSPESIAILQEADIVITNPPFSLFREYIAQLMEYGKQFIVLGNVNALTYKEIFPLVKNNQIWLGASIHSGDRKFYVPDDYPLNASGCGVDTNGRKFIRVKGVRWYTNMDYSARHNDLETAYLYAKRDFLYPDLYPKYDNYDAINVDKTSEIPMDYNGVMGVPITFMDKYNPEQFEIVGFRKGLDGKSLYFTREKEREFNCTFEFLFGEYCKGVPLNDEGAQLEKYFRIHQQNIDNQLHVEPVDVVYPSCMAILGCMNSPKDTVINGQKKYARILIKRKEI